MAIKIGANFEYQGKQPNFARDSFATKAAMKAFPEASMDEGHLSYCAEDGNMYQFKSSNTADATLGKWRVFKSGNQVALTVDSAMSDTSTNPVQNKVIKNYVFEEVYNVSEGLQATNNALTDFKTSVASTYAKKTDISTVYRYKGTKASYSALPSTGNTTGDVWNITAADTAHGVKAGDNVVWSGTAWDNLSGTVDLGGYVPRTSSGDVTITANKLTLQGNDDSSETSMLVAGYTVEVRSDLNDLKLNTGEGYKVLANGKEVATVDKITALENTIKTLQGTVTSLQGTVTAQQTTIASLQAKVDAQPKQVVLTQAAYDALETKDSKTIYYING